MPSTEDDFKQRFSAMMQDLRNGHKADPEAMFRLGSLAARLIDKAGAKDWRSYKAALQPAHTQILLADFQKRGNALYAEGKQKQAYAIQVLAMSVVGARYKDPMLQKGVRVLDRLIGFYTTAYRKAAAISQAAG